MASEWAQSLADLPGYVAVAYLFLRHLDHRDRRLSKELSARDAAVTLALNNANASHLAFRDVLSRLTGVGYDHAIDHRATVGAPASLVSESTLAPVPVTGGGDRGTQPPGKRRNRGRRRKK